MITWESLSDEQRDAIRSLAMDVAAATVPLRVGGYTKWPSVAQRLMEALGARDHTADMRGAARALLGVPAAPERGEGGRIIHDLWRNRPTALSFSHEAKLGFPLQARAHGYPGT